MRKYIEFIKIVPKKKTLDEDEIGALILLGLKLLLYNMWWSIGLGSNVLFDLVRPPFFSLTYCFSDEDGHNTFSLLTLHLLPALLNRLQP